MQTPSRHLANKRLVRDRFQAIAEAPPAGLAAALARAYHPDAAWRGAHPLNELVGLARIEAVVWQPLRHSLPDLERRDTILVAGEYGGHDFVGAVGRYCAVFRNDWLGIPATGRPITLRFGEFHRLRDGLIVQSSVLIDILDLIRQAGVWPLAPSLGVEGLWPEPFTGAATSLAGHDPATGAANLAQMRAMQDALGDHGDWQASGRDAFLLPSQVAHWHPKMMWYGPSGIGATRGIEGFVDDHRLPWRRAFHNTVGGQHYVRLGEGDITATGGWPSVTTEHLGGGFLGLGPTGRKIEMRVMDFYLHHDGMIRENWVPIDIIDILRQMDIDVFARIRALSPNRR